MNIATYLCLDHVSSSAPLVENWRFSLKPGLDASIIISFFLFLLDFPNIFFFRIPHPVRLVRISSELRLSDGASILSIDPWVPNPPPPLRSVRCAYRNMIHHRPLGDMRVRRVLLRNEPKEKHTYIHPRRRTSSIYGDSVWCAWLEWHKEKKGKHSDPF